MLRSVSLAMAFTVLALPAIAQDRSGSNLDPTAAASSAGGAMTLGLAHDLYVLGNVEGDALTVLAAAKRAATVTITPAKATTLDPARLGLEDIDRESFASSRAIPAIPATPDPIPAAQLRPAAKTTLFTATSGDEGAANAPVTAEGMFAKARDLAAGDQAILTLIDATLAETLAEPPSWPTVSAVRWLSHLNAGQADVWEVPFPGNLPAEIAILGDGDTNLDITVSDENGTTLCQEVSRSDTLSCGFTPARDGYFYIAVQNMGPVRNSYHLITN